jgi:hypothetical protein
MGVSQPGRAVEYFLHALADKSSRGCIGRCTTWEEINRLMVSLGAIFFTCYGSGVFSDEAVVL